MTDTREVSQIYDLGASYIHVKGFFMGNSFT
jgi:hypothetical protein